MSRGIKQILNQSISNSVVGLYRGHCWQEDPVQDTGLQDLLALAISHDTCKCYNKCYLYSKHTQISQYGEKVNKSMWLLVRQGLIEEWNKSQGWSDQTLFDSEKLKNCTGQVAHVHLAVCIISFSGPDGNRWIKNMLSRTNPFHWAKLQMYTNTHNLNLLTINLLKTGTIHISFCQPYKYFSLFDKCWPASTKIGYSLSIPYN